MGKLILVRDERQALLFLAEHKYLTANQLSLQMNTIKRYERAGIVKMVHVVLNQHVGARDGFVWSLTNAGYALVNSFPEAPANGFSRPLQPYKPEARR